MMCEEPAVSEVYRNNRGSRSSSRRSCASDITMDELSQHQSEQTLGVVAKDSATTAYDIGICDVISIAIDVVEL